MRIEDIANIGVIGAGGAGFPTHVKLASNPDTLIMNAAECEPLLHKDMEILHHYSVSSNRVNYRYLWIVWCKMWRLFITLPEMSRLLRNLFL